MNVSLWRAMPRFFVMLPRVCAWLCLIEPLREYRPNEVYGNAYRHPHTNCSLRKKLKSRFIPYGLHHFSASRVVHIVCSGDIRDFGLFQPAYYCSACVDIADRHISSTKGRNISRSVSIYVICCTISNTNVLKSSIRFDGI